ncbi:peptide chain release factor N(5)-glutamine methyltransferase [Vibrio sp. TH_r3]|uniref:peptide chain release factor N(5)-glutamine methyltransferase n=1 Tax=Vibrio sp. TH_r3 TaxID=3082084 RepID=UPI002955DCDD|nr:peptide chain release factor N(5)-glutamine methyltransferase [Vibrio sp. TH_r3]MDV7106311.1 peptide chain release factor N(5)-glutamine methyltransferase [Vibrio sp. TH_r3]
MDTNLSIETTLKTAITALIESGSDSPSLDASVLLCHVLGQSRSYLLTWPEKILSEEQYLHFIDLLQRRLTGEPIAYITGEREFWSLPLAVSPSTLIPRPDTERLVEITLTKLPRSAAFILDLGTGTGAIALALASECPQHQIVGIDIQMAAIGLAQKNAENLKIDNTQFLCGSWFEPLGRNEQEQKACVHNERIHHRCSLDNDSRIKFAAIVSNPPYIEQNDPHLTEGDVRFEPSTALVAQDNGLSDIRIIATQAINYLENDGWLLFEHGCEQGKLVRDIMLGLGYTQVSTEQDYAGNDRVTLGQYSFNS